MAEAPGGAAHGLSCGAGTVCLRDARAVASRDRGGTHDVIVDPDTRSMRLHRDIPTGN